MTPHERLTALTVRSWLPGPAAAAALCSALLSSTVVAGVLAVPAAADPVRAGDANPGAGGVPAAGTDRYLVRYADGADLAAAARSLRAQDVAVRRTFGHAVKAAVVTATAEEAAALAESPLVEAVEPDTRVRVAETQTGAPWGLDRVDQRSLPLSTTFTAPASGAGVSVYVLDTGVAAGHPDFGGRVVSGWTAIADGRGTGDCHGHGTHVAGTVAGTTYGVAKAAAVVPVRVLGCDGGGYLSDVVRGLDWVAGHHAAGTPAVVNLSLGGGTSTILDDALEAVIADGVTAAVAAGNSATDACQASPARVPAALTVAATDSADRQASFSNHGSCVDLYAPGVGIVSAAPAGGTAAMSGTSMATPHVAGAAAVLLSAAPALTPAQVASRINGDATPGVVTRVSTGTPNRLLHLAPADQPAPVATAPKRATKVSAGARRRAARVSWVQGADGGSPLTQQEVRVYRGTRRVATLTVPASATAVKVTGLRPRRAYVFTVVERNAVGSSRESARSNKVYPRR